MLNFIRPFQYCSTFILYFLGYIAFTNSGVFCWIPLIFTFFFVPTLEFLISPDPHNLTDAEEQIVKSNIFYDFILYVVLPLQFLALIVFLKGFQQADLSGSDIFGRVISMGLLCSIFGINVAHELGHRIKPFEQFFAKCLLLTSLYMHFFIEHNKGHHRMVGTPNDPSTAKFNQSVYRFYVQTFIGTYKHAWKIAIDEATKNKSSLPVLFNQMALFQIIQIAFVCLIGYVFGATTMSYFLIAAILGTIMLETVNYIEHYGLSRNLVRDHVYERVQPHHSWNSNHVIGRLLLFELSRHSDHHYLASRKYPMLRHMENAPQMPTGYPGMIILSLVPPLWFKVMHKQMKKYDLL
jgi:alkane 1-monooxygenase